VNAGISFNGCDLKGLGFMFDDRNPRSTPLEQMRRLLVREPHCAEVIRPYVGGEDINGHPTHHKGRYVIDFAERDEEAASQFSACFEIVRRRVKPERLRRPGPVARWPWWRFWRSRAALRQAIVANQLSHVHACSLVSHHWAVARVPADRVFSHKVGVFCCSEFAFGAVLQSRAHEVWARFLSSTLGDALNYSPSDAFETFPFPEGWRADPTLNRLGRRYDALRAAMLVLRGVGLTRMYHRFHHPEHHDPDLVQLRVAHAALDRAVLDAYGWDDLEVSCEFQLDYPIDEATWSSRKRKPYRLRWPRSIHDEVLARLLALNQRRAVDG